MLVSAYPYFADTTPEFFGYFESQVTGAAVKDDFYFLNTNKLRLDIKSEITEKITFVANVNLTTFHGKSNWNIPDFLPERISSGIDPAMLPLYSVEFKDEIKLDNAWVKIGFRKFDIVLGKQQISLGTGYVWNPVDVFNIKDALDPTYEQPGHNAMRIDIPLSGSTTLTGIFSPDNDISDSSKLIRIKTKISHFDLIFIGIEKRWKFNDYNEFDFEKPGFTGVSESRKLLGFACAGELLGIGVWSEIAVNYMEITDNFYEMVFGADYTFDFQTYVMAEYYRNTLGRTSSTLYTLNDYMRVFTSEQKAMARDQLYLMASHPVSDLLTMSLSSIISITDGSLALVPTFTYNLSDNVDITGYLNVNIGDENELFSTKSGSGGLLRVRAYF